MLPGICTFINTTQHPPTFLDGSVSSPSTLPRKFRAYLYVHKDFPLTLLFHTRCGSSTADISSRHGKLHEGMNDHARPISPPLSLPADHIHLCRPRLSRLVLVNTLCIASKDAAPREAVSRLYTFCKCWYAVFRYTCRGGLILY